MADSYSFSPSRMPFTGSRINEQSKSAALNPQSSWKKNDFVNIPETVLNTAKDINIVKRTVKLSIYGHELNIVAREALPLRSHPQIHVLLLHGASFTSKTWQNDVVSQNHPEVNTLSLIAAAGHRAIAIDLPNYGTSTAAEIPHDERAHFLQHFIDAEQLDRIVVISPSMSGSYSVPFIMGQTTLNVSHKVRGYVPIAPVDTAHFTPAQYKQCQIPTMIVYGSKDAILGIQSLDNLCNIGNNEIFPMEGANHPCYLYNPNEWHWLIYNFLCAIE